MDTIMTNDKKDKLLLDLGTFGSVSNLPAHFHVDTVNVTLRPHSDDVRPTIHHTFLECNDRSMCYSAQEDEELDDLWSLLREDIIEIKDEKNSSSPYPRYSAEDSEFLQLQNFASSATNNPLSWQRENVGFIVAPVYHLMQEGGATAHTALLAARGCDHSNLISFERFQVEVMPQHILPQETGIAPPPEMTVDQANPQGDESWQVSSRTNHQLFPFNAEAYEFSDKDCDSRSSSSLDSSRDHSGIFDLNEPADPGKWSARYNELLEYRESYGHCNVPYHYKEKPFLNSWVKRQRYQYKCMVQGKPTHLTNERIRLLDAIDFAWDTHALAWEANYEAFRKYVIAHQHGHIPAKETRLFAWAKRQRRQHKLWLANKDSTMTEDRYRRLTKLGFRWGSHPLKTDSSPP